MAESNKYICQYSGQEIDTCLGQVSEASRTSLATQDKTIVGAINEIRTNTYTKEEAATQPIFNAKEKVGNVTSGVIDLANGPIQICSATSITLPQVESGYTLMLVCTAKVTSWTGNIKWQNVRVPTLSTGYDNVIMFTGVGNYWLGSYGGIYGVAS